MSKPSNNEFENEKETKDITEGIYLEGERTPVEHEAADENTVTEGIYLKGERSVVERDPVPEQPLPEIVRSTRSSSFDKRKHRSSRGSSSHHEDSALYEGGKKTVERDPVPEQPLPEIVRSTRSSSFDKRKHRSSHGSSLNHEDRVLYEGGKKTVERDPVSVKDEASDYIFLNPRRRKHHHHSSSSHHHSSSSGSSHHHSSSLVSSTRSSSHHHHHHHHHRWKNMEKWKKVLIIIVSVLLAVTILLLGTLMILIINGKGDLFTDKYNITGPQGAEIADDGREVYYNGHKYRLNESVTNLLLMGVDKENIDEKAENGMQGQADVIVVMAYDTKNKRITLINIPRDLMTDVPMYTARGEYTKTEKQQICLAYAYGDGKDRSCENVVNVVQRLFYNMPVKTYFALDLDGIVALNDSIGGVDVVSPETIDMFVKGQNYHLLGDSAESFVRSRRHDTAEANLLRNERQKTYANSFMNEMLYKTKRNISTPVNVFNASSPYSATNLNAGKVSYLAKEMVMGGTPVRESVSIEGTTTLNGNHAEFKLKEKEFYELFLRVYYEMVS